MVRDGQRTTLLWSRAEGKNQNSSQLTALSVRKEMTDCYRAKDTASTNVHRK